jgi:hypothetical protein
MISIFLIFSSLFSFNKRYVIEIKKLLSVRMIDKFLAFIDAKNFLSF